MVEFRVFGNPIPQGRPRFYRRGNFVGAYDPDKSKNWKETVKWQVIEQKVPLLNGAISIELIFCLLRPKSLPKKVVYHIKRPDVDNLVKGFLDAVKGICFLDDAQIVQLFVEKRYEEPLGVHIKIVSLE